MAAGVALEHAAGAAAPAGPRLAAKTGAPPVDRQAAACEATVSVAVPVTEALRSAAAGPAAAHVPADAIAAGSVRHWAAGWMAIIACLACRSTRDRASFQPQPDTSTGKLPLVGVGSLHLRWQAIVGTHCETPLSGAPRRSPPNIQLGCWQLSCGFSTCRSCAKGSEGQSAAARAPRVSKCGGALTATTSAPVCRRHAEHGLAFRWKMLSAEERHWGRP